MHSPSLPLASQTRVGLLVRLFSNRAPSSINRWPVRSVDSFRLGRTCGLGYWNVETAVVFGVVGVVIYLAVRRR